MHKGKPVFGNSHIILTKNPADCPILDNWFFDNLTLADESCAKASQILETCASVNNNLCGKLVSLVESSITFDERFQVTLVPFFNPEFNLLSYELNNFTFKVLHLVILYRYYFKTKWNYNALTVSFEKFKKISFASSIMKNIVAFWSIFQAKLVCCIAFGTVSIFCCLLKSVTINLQHFLKWV